MRNARRGPWIDLLFISGGFGDKQTRGWWQVQEYAHRLLLLKVFLSPTVVSLAPPTSKERKKKHRAETQSHWWFQAWHTAEGANCFWKKKGSICSYAAPQKLSLPLISGYSHSSLYYLLFELVLEYIKWLVWFSGVRFLSCLQQYRLHLKFLILCQFKRGKVPDGERKNNGLVRFGGGWWGEGKEGGVAARTSSALLIFLL